MPGNQFGQLFQVSTFGESHGPAIGVVLDGVPPNLDLSEQDIQLDLDRRRPGQSDVTTPRNEADKVEILSGVFEGKTTGAPLAMMIRNQDQRSKDYGNIKDIYRPGHADFTYQEKYGIRDYRGGGRSSGRETACRVAAGAVAKQLLKTLGVRIVAYTASVGDIDSEICDFSVIESNKVRAADPVAAKKMESLIQTIHKDGDSIGGVVEAQIMGCPVGLGDPCFDKLEAMLAHAVMSIGTIKGVEFGSGFQGTKMRGSEHNDIFTVDDGAVKTETNNAGGTLGGISNGADITLRMAVKPTSSIGKRQRTITKNQETTEMEIKGRHDPCICPRVVPVVEAMLAITIADRYLVQQTIR